MGPENEEIIKFRPFDGKDWDNWKFRVECILDEKGLLEFTKLVEDASLREDETDSERVKNDKKKKREEWKRNDKKAKNIIIQRIADSHLEYVKEKDTTYEVWSALVKNFERKGIANQLYIRKQLLSMKLNEADNMNTHLMKFDKLIRNLKSAGGKIEENDQITMLLMTLPDTFQTLVTALETMSVDKLSLDFVKSRLLDEEIKRNNNGTVDSSEAKTPRPAFYSRNYQIRCHNCMGYGHKKYECRKKGGGAFRRNFHYNPNLRRNANKSINEDKEKDSTSFMSDKKLQINENWFLDSGASDHMVNNEDWFTEIKNLDKAIKIRVAKYGEYMTATKIGNINVISHVNNKIIKCVVEDVLYVPELSSNLFSVRKVEKGGKKVMFNKNKALIFKGKKLLATAQCVNNLYALNFEILTRQANITLKDDYVLWHKRLGHLGKQNIYKLLGQNMADGIKIAGNQADKKNLCESCIYGKHCRLPFDSKLKEKRSRRILEIVHSDVCGPFTPETWNKKKYFVSFIDDFSHVTVTYLMSNKNEVFKYFQEYKSMAEVQTGERISKLKCDNGREYVNSEMNNFCTKNGITLDLSAPYTPENNGTAERMNRTLVEKARTMMNDADLPKYLWGESILTATYITNRCPTKAVIENKTPIEMWLKRKPNLKWLRIFGCPAYVFIPKEQRRKLDSKANKCVFVGYTNNGYRLWDAKKRRIIISRNVIFDEEKILKEEMKEMSPIRTDINKENVQESKILNKEEIREDNIEYEEQENFGFLVGPIMSEPSTVKEAIQGNEAMHWEQAMKEEFESLKENNTWKLVELPNGRNVITNKWVFRKKYNADGKIEKYKARLVARGFDQIAGIDYHDTFSPVVRISAIRTILALAVKLDLTIHQMDVVTAYLNGDLEEEIYMIQPETFIEKGKENHVCLLKKSLYGLKQSGRQWFKKLDMKLKEFGFDSCQSDSCVYVKKEPEINIIAVYVDDLIIAASNKKTLECLKQNLQKIFKMKDLGELSYCLGIEFKINKNKSISMCQKKYTRDILKKYGMDNSKGVHTPMDPNVKLTRSDDMSKEVIVFPYREAVGSLMYLSTSTRPDITFAVNFLSQFNTRPEKEHCVALKRILRYLQFTLNFGLKYEKDDSNITGFADADWGNNIVDRKSYSGYVFTMTGAAITWEAKKQDLCSSFKHRS